MGDVVSLSVKYTLKLAVCVLHDAGVDPQKLTVGLLMSILKFSTVALLFRFPSYISSASTYRNA